MVKYDPEIHHRQSIRLQGYDYSQAGAYFVTICVQNKACLFGEIVDGKMLLNDPGKVIKRWYYALENKFSDIKCGAFICMPNHVHFIIININVGADLRVCPVNRNLYKQGEHTGSPLHRVIQWFKTMSTNEYIRGVKQYNWIPFSCRLWQRNYYEHIVRNESEMNKICEYIQNNPMNWETDSFFVYPSRLFMC